MKFRDITPFGVRFPTELKEKIEKSAKENHRSMNAEIVAKMLEAYGEKASRSAQELTDGELIDEIVRRWGPDAILIKVSPKDDDQK